MSAPVLLCEIEFTAGTWTPVSEYLLRPSSVVITRGRQGDGRTSSPGSMTLALRNDDGRFTPDLTTGAYHPNVRRGRGIRLSAWVNGAWSRRFTGFVTAWDVGGIRKGVGAACVVTAVDRGGLGRRPLESVAREVLRRAGAIAYWPMTETDGDSFADVMGRGFPALTLTSVGDGVTIDRGAGAAMPSDPAGTLRFRNDPDDASSSVRVESGILSMMPAAFTLGMWVGSGGGYLLRLGRNLGDGIEWSQNVNLDKAILTEKALGSTTTLIGSSGDSMEPMLITLTISNGTIHGGFPFTPASSTRPQEGRSFRDCTITIGQADAGSFGGFGGGHIFVIPRVLTPTELAQLHTDLAAGQDDLKTLMGNWYSWVGDTGAVQVHGTTQTVLQIPTDGSSPYSLGQAYAEALDCRHVFDRDGLPAWYATDHNPTPVTIPPEWVVADDFRYATDPTRYLASVTAEYPDGSSDTWTKESPEEYTSLTVTGVSWSHAVGLGLIRQIATKADGGPRAPQVTIRAGRLSEADRAVVAGLDVADRLVLDELPEALPESLSVRLEGYVEVIGEGWDFTLNLSRDAASFRIGLSRLGGPDTLG